MAKGRRLEAVKQQAPKEEVPADLPHDQVVLRGPQTEKFAEYEVDDDFEGGTFRTRNGIMRRGVHIEADSIVRLTAAEASPIRESLERVKLDKDGNVLSEAKRRMPRAMSVVRR